MSNWSEMTISAPSRPKIPIYVGRDADGEITNHLKMAKTKTEERHQNEGQKSPKKKNSVRYPFYFVEKLQQKIKRKIPKQNTNCSKRNRKYRETDTGKITNRKFISGPIFQIERKGSAINTNGEINPKNRHCLRGLDGKYGRWDEILRNILNGKLKIVQNRKATDTDTEQDDDDDEEVPEEGQQKHTTLSSVTEGIHPGLLYLCGKLKILLLTCY